MGLQACIILKTPEQLHDTAITYCRIWGIMNRNYKGGVQWPEV